MEPEPTPRRHTDGSVDVVLISSVKTMQDHAAPAADLYTSPLFLKRRTFAEESGATWFILSAMHGLVEPEQVLEPYDMYLAGQPQAYRRDWGNKVVSDLTSKLGSLEGLVVEIHAGSTYVEPLEPQLRAAGAEVRVPLRRLSQGEHLGWYDGDPVPPPAPVAKRARSASRPAAVPEPVVSGPRLADLTSVIEEAAGTLMASTPARVSEFPWGRSDLEDAGLYAWWADAEAAADLGVDMQPGRTLIYVSQAGATVQPSGKRSDATLLSQIGSQELSGTIVSSTLRRTLAALLLEELSLQIVESKTLDPVSEERLSGWIVSRLSTTVWPTPYRDQLGEIEVAVITRLNAPLNLRGTASSDLRHRLRQGRRAFGSAEPS